MPEQDCVNCGGHRPSFTSSAVGRILQTEKTSTPHPWHTGTGALALFPKTAKDVDEWEQRALAMHAQQETIRLDAKPEENTLAARKRIMRGD